MINYVTTFNYGYADFAANNIGNFISVISNKKNKLTLVALDEEAHEYVSSFIESIREEYDISNISLKKDYINAKHAAGFNTELFFTITHKKIDVILKEIRENEVIHFFDSDVFFFKDPSSLIIEKLKDNDIVFQQDSPRVHNHPLYSNYVCTGNFSVKRNDRSIQFFETIKNRLIFGKNDQEVVYEYLNSVCSNIREYELCTLDVYDPELFQNGFDTFQANWHEKQSKIAIHANHMVGKDTKVNSLKSVGAWLLD